MSGEIFGACTVASRFIILVSTYSAARPCLYTLSEAPLPFEPTPVPTEMVSICGQNRARYPSLDANSTSTDHVAPSMTAHADVRVASGPSFLFVRGPISREKALAPWHGGCDGQFIQRFRFAASRRGTMREERGRSTWDDRCSYRCAFFTGREGPRWQKSWQIRGAVWQPSRTPCDLRGERPDPPTHPPGLFPLGRGAELPPWTPVSPQAAGWPV